MDGVFLGRVHNVGTLGWPNSSTVVFEISQDGYTDEDPAQIWNVPTPGGFGTLATFAATDTGPIVRVGGIVAALGVLPPLVQIRMKLITAGTGGAIKATFSADLNLKESK